MSNLLENLNEQFELINGQENQIPQIEMDIFMRNIQKLYEKTIHLNKLNSKQDFNVKEENIETKVEQKEEDKIVVAPELKKEEVVKEDIQPKAEEKVEDIETKLEEPVLEAQEIIVDLVEKEQLAEKEQKEIEIKKEVVESAINTEEKEIVEIKEVKAEVENLIDEPVLPFDDILEEEITEADLFSEIKVNDEITDLNKKLAEARNTQSIVEKLQNKRIESLKSVIGINDKFYFINELFSGNSQKYEDIIYTLNNFKKLEDAMVYFSTLKYKFGWDEESEAYLKLMQMLERKFEFANA